MEERVVELQKIKTELAKRAFDTQCYLTDMEILIQQQHDLIIDLWLEIQDLRASSGVRRSNS